MHARANDIVREARSLVGTRYGHQGRGAELDCAGLVIVAGRAAGVTDFDTLDYSRLPRPREMKAAMMRAGCMIVPYAERAHGDILVMRTGNSPIHLGVLDVDGGVEWVIHATNEPSRKIVDRDRLDTLDGRVLYAWRFPE